MIKMNKKKESITFEINSYKYNTDLSMTSPRTSNSSPCHLGKKVIFMVY